MDFGKDLQKREGIKSTTQNQKLKSGKKNNKLKTIQLKSTGKQSGKSMESVLKKQRRL